MTKTTEAALQEFLSSIATAYPEFAVPDDAATPYITYSASTGFFGDGEQSCTVNIWMKTTSEAKINAMAKKLSDAIGRSGAVIQCDNGAMWIKRGSPFSQPVDSGDKSLKRRYINISIEYLTE